MILSTAMMLKYSCGEPDLASAVEKAVENAIEKGTRTKDIEGTASTGEMGDAVARELERLL